MSGTRTTARLVRRAQQGDHKAFADLYRLHFNQVYYIAYKMLHNEQEATEVTQDAFEAAYQKISNLNNPATFQRWVNIITHNLCANILRARTKNQNYYTEVTMNEQDLPLSEKSREFLPEAYLDSEEDRATVVRLVGELPAAQKEAVLMYYFEDFSAAEIAKIAGTKETTIHRRLFDARQTLKRRLGEPSVSGKSLALGASSVPVLTQILKSEATSNAATPGFQSAFSSAWEHLAHEIPTLSPSSVPPPKAPVAGATKTGITTFTKSLIAALAAVAIIGTGAALYAANIPVKRPPVVVKERVGLPAIPNVDVLESVEASATEEAETPPSSVSSPTGHETARNKPAEPVTKKMAKPAPTPAPIVRPTIEVDQCELAYPAGTVVPLKAVLADVGAVAYDAEGARIPVTVALYEQIDFMNEGTYVLSLSARDARGTTSNTQVITILVK